MTDYPEAETGTEQPADTTSENDEAQTSLLPKSLFGGDCKVGDTYTVKVVGVLEDELEVEPVKKGESSDEAPGKSRMQMAGDKLDMMNEGA